MARPNEGRVKLNCYVLPETLEKIKKAVVLYERERNTLGKIVDRAFSTDESPPQNKCK